MRGTVSGTIGTAHGSERPAGCSRCDNRIWTWDPVGHFWRGRAVCQIQSADLRNLLQVRKPEARTPSQWWVCDACARVISSRGE